MRHRGGAAGRPGRARGAWLRSLALLLLAGGGARAQLAAPAPHDVGEPPEVTQAQDERALSAACGALVPVIEAGQEVGLVCSAEARRQGLTIVDLSDDWVPLALRDSDDPMDSRQPYRPTYVALANEEFPPGPEGDRARHDAFLEVYGIFPSLRVVAGRLLDEERHGCHAAVDLAPLQALSGGVRPAAAPANPAARAALAALAQRLACERVLPTSATPPTRWGLQEALETYQRKHTIVSRGVLGAETRRVLAEDSRELDYRTLLRSLRARVVDATGIIEDGTAQGARGTVLSRHIDGDAFYAADVGPLADGAPDLVSIATEAAAEALGWTDPLAAVEFFRRRGPDATRRLAVALRLPRAPAYHADHMDLRVVIDRGDVWYELPARRGSVARRPTLTVFARTAGGEEVPLVRWPTTIGGWKKEVGRAGRVGLRYKNSEVGKRVWRDLVASPAWLPPPQTPARALIRRAYGPDKWLPETDLLGPGYASAYGLVMLVHHRAVRNGDFTIWYENGIRTHGSVSYQSILNGSSHGCHRLFNHAALQLASFLLQHRRHVRHGLVDKPFTHEFTWRGINVKHPIAHRGYRFELAPPVPVNVLQGTVRGRIREVPHRFVRLSRPRPAMTASAVQN